MIEKQLGPKFDIALPIAEQDAITDFVTNFVTWATKGRRSLASESSGLPVYRADPEEVKAALPAATKDRRALIALAPGAADYLAFAWENVNDLKVLPGNYDGLGDRIEAMNKVLPLRARLKSPMSKEAIDAYGELSPRIGAALALFPGQEFLHGWAFVFGLSDAVDLRTDDDAWMETPVPHVPEVLTALVPGAMQLVRG